MSAAPIPRRAVWRRLLLPALAAALLERTAGARRAGAEPAGIPALRRGVNLSHWFQYAGRRRVGPDDLSMLRAVGFDHVRIPFDPVFLGWRMGLGPDMPGLDRLRDGVTAAIAAGLDVMLDMHPADKVKAAIENDAANEAAIARLWTYLARAFRDLPPRHLAFELLNEPQYYGFLGAARWNGFQRDLAAAVRAEAPHHLILATGHKGSGADSLTSLTPLPDANVAYAFHAYLPYIFTHQGADWLTENPGTAAAFVRGLAYPAKLADSRPGEILTAARRRQAEAELAAYRRDDWDGGRIRRQFAPIQAWASANKVRLQCNEFGVLRTATDPASRYRWIADMRTALEERGFGWTLWDYADIFGIIDPAPGPAAAPRLEAAARIALGLRAGPP